MENNRTFTKIKFILFSFLIFIANMNISYAVDDTGVAACKGLLGTELTEILLC